MKKFNIKELTMKKEVDETQDGNWKIEDERQRGPEKEVPNTLEI